jgi:ketosteroid isomerase-like protein
MAPSAEVTQLMSKFYEAASKGDYEFLDRIVSRQAGMLWIGTDPAEWWDTPGAVSKAWRAQTAQLGRPAAITGGKTTAWQHGDVAWVSDQPVFHLADGRKVPFRLTVVWLREPEGWRIVQAHTSFGVPNEAVVRPA